MVDEKKSKKKEDKKNSHDEKSDVTLKLPHELYDNLQKLIEGTGFRSVTEFIIFTMRSIAGSGELDNKVPEKDAQDVLEKLKSLGYIK